MSSPKPRKAKVKLSRIVTEVAIVTLDKDGCIEEVDDVHEELDSEDEEILSVIEVVSVHG